MGRRSRKRGAGDIAPAPAGAPPARRVPARRDERPRAPWHPFPLVELCVLIGLVLLVWGLIRLDDDGGRVMLVCGMALASLGGLDTALREHFDGYASHAFLLAALPAVLVAGVLFFAGAPWLAIPLAAAPVFAGAFVALRRAFRPRS
jgi:cell division protein FtsW (lipid II flippase)